MLLTGRGAAGLGGMALAPRAERGMGDPTAMTGGGLVWGGPEDGGTDANGETGKAGLVEGAADGAAAAELTTRLFKGAANRPLAPKGPAMATVGLGLLPRG